MQRTNNPPESIDLTTCPVKVVIDGSLNIETWAQVIAKEVIHQLGKGIL